MKPEFDKETDALLRDHARRGVVRARDGAASFAREGLSPDRGIASAEHLDADELNAFAENAAPEAARSRYLSHLADCDDCRRAATTLALAANVALARDEPEALKEKIVATSWRARLTALFAPGAWRYAMPVVALLCVGVVAVVMMRRVPLSNRETARQDEAQRSNSNVAEQEQTATGIAARQSAESPAQTRTYDAPSTPSGEVAQRNDDARTDQKRSQAGGLIAPASQGAATTTGGVPVTTGAPPEVAQRRVEELPPPPAASSVPALAATPAAQPKPQEDTLSMAKDAPKSARDEEVAGRTEAQKSRRAGESKRGESSESAPPPSRAMNRAALNSDVASTADRSGGSRARQSESRAREDKEKQDSEPAGDSSAETRKVAGRKFRRQGDSWIDTAYNSSQAATVVRRNSEQYRALVADAPEIGRIANALGGEVVVVWKGRAYRIKS
jgi:hypothetical protein